MQRLYTLGHKKTPQPQKEAAVFFSEKEIKAYFSFNAGVRPGV